MAYRIHSSPRYAVPLEVLRDAGHPMTIREWFTSDPRLSGYSPDERKGIVLKLRGGGYIEHGPRVICHLTPDGRPSPGVKLDTWRAR